MRRDRETHDTMREGLGALEDADEIRTSIAVDVSFDGADLAGVRLEGRRCDSLGR